MKDDESPWKVDLKVFGKTVNFKIYSGADKVPIRCQRMLVGLRRFNVKTEHAAVKIMIVTDTLSRCPIDSRNDSDIYRGDTVLCQ